MQLSSQLSSQPSFISVKRRKGRNIIDTKKFGISVLTGLIVIFVIAIISSGIFTFILKLTDVKESGLQMIITAIAFISLFIGGFISGGKGQEKGWMLGGATGLGYTIIILLFQYLGHNQLFNLHQMIYHICFILVAAMGGILGVNLTSKTRSA